jgi:hypothetical protein
VLDVADALVVVVAVKVDGADFPPLQAVAASATAPISTACLTNCDGSMVQAAPASRQPSGSPPSTIERLSLRARSQRACSTRSGAFRSLQSWHRSEAVRRRGSGNSPPQARQMISLINMSWTMTDT